MPQPDARTFEEFVRHRLPALFRYACVLTGDRHDAEDVVQEALARTGAGWWRVRRKDDPEGYVRTAMVRIVLNRRRGAARERLTADPPDRAVEDGALTRITADAALDAALAGLPPRMRAVLVLRYVDQLTDAEIAEVLGCTAATVRSQASRALAKLRGAAAVQEGTRG
ncbi:SigE family RNA polymerase sigma factor [Actinomadura parmotrematis]|uniref:SigE family RNA polymerase sigma factor n=1 Tax=Actinomadura parmotrematis TaxID=2864039 RepID=A0ABS7G0H3_9ACTN|nr:SigE family RNA polymerase sigma factor [Actinomadura parmotrematis]MBW8485890.1 SigE family RNA polymerase sigma factor [Actinomadura parmotrematis]